MKITKFEEVIAWQKSQDLAANIYHLFKGSQNYSFKDQIIRASISISNNIAERFDRGSNKQFLYFIFVSKSSCSEVKSMLYLAIKCEILLPEIANSLIAKCDEVNRIIFGLINWLKKNEWNHSKI